MAFYLPLRGRAITPRGACAILHRARFGRLPSPFAKNTMPILKPLRVLAGAMLCAAAAAHADPLSYARYDQVRTSDLHPT